jgi:replication factor A1
MHAQAYPLAAEQIKEVIKEGKVYNICYFRVRKCGNYKPVETDMMMFFSKWTKVEERIQVPPAFPEIVYTLASMEQIQSRAEKIQMLIGNNFSIFSYALTI